MGQWQTKRVIVQDCERFVTQLNEWLDKPTNPYLVAPRDWEQTISWSDKGVVISGNEIFIEANLSEVIQSFWDEPFEIVDVTSPRGAVDILEQMAEDSEQNDQFQIIQ